jgi:hypothetical protein
MKSKIQRLKATFVEIYINTKLEKLTRRVCPFEAEISSPESDMSDWDLQRWNSSFLEDILKLIRHLGLDRMLAIALLRRGREAREQVYWRILLKSIFRHHPQVSKLSVLNPR